MRYQKLSGLEAELSIVIVAILLMFAATLISIGGGPGLRSDGDLALRQEIAQPVEAPTTMMALATEE